MRASCITTPSPSAPVVSATKFSHFEKPHATASPATSAVKSNPLEKPHKTVVTGPHKLKSDRLGMFERKDEQLPSPTRVTASHNYPAKKTEPFHPSPSPVLSSSGTVSPSRDSVTSNGMSSFYSPSDSGYEAGVDEFNLHQSHHHEEPPIEEPHHVAHPSSVTKSVPPTSSYYEEPPFDAPVTAAQSNSNAGE
ncbi:hypothetical protein OESDEN_16749 [Oesophagostomum dentatum]|uniref:Uncharacterized protein n=1 Tax=Oesophagostomum dentatum TaxID=61180 RepID=A0A0B1SI28_OESDE|nr:hypothetical protein OESDEN_16749 [Oesophagostomum dentatum]